MRNIFDQYHQPENRVTHALVSCLARDGDLLRDFVGMATGRIPPRGERLHVQEQSLPGDPEPSEEEAERRGLPDAVIHDDEGWCLAIESKVAATPTIDQIRRHRASLEKRAFRNIELLLLTAKEPRTWPNAECGRRSWAEIYLWLRKWSGRSIWAAQAAEYLEIQEQKLIEQGYLQEGTLTVFAGFDFGPDRPYSYMEAKRLIRLAMDRLRNDKRLATELGANLAGGGRTAITGREGTSVWDFIPLQGAKSDLFTKSPHLTLAITAERVIAHLTIPNGIGNPYRRNLDDLGAEGFRDVLLDIEERTRPLVKAAQGAAPWLIGVQRHYRHQRAIPIEDAKIEFDLRTATTSRHVAGVKPMPEWIDAAYRAWSTRRKLHANYQIAVGVHFPFARCNAIRQPEAAELVAEAWLACKPLLSALHAELRA